MQKVGWPKAYPILISVVNYLIGLVGWNEKRVFKN
jgi:hypothetical protein